MTSAWTVPTFSLQNIPGEILIGEEEPSEKYGFEGARGLPEFNRKDKGDGREISDHDRVNFSDRDGMDRGASGPDEVVFCAKLKNPMMGETGREGKP